jgi:hypothetical protein
LKEGSPASLFFMADDVIQSVNAVAVNTTEALQAELIKSHHPSFQVWRKGRTITFAIVVEEGHDYWPVTRVKKNSEASDEQKLRYDDWMQSLF